MEPSIKAEYKDDTYHKGYFCEDSDIDIKIIMFKDKIAIPPILQSYVLHWYHTYFLYPIIDRTEAMIFQHFYCPDIRDAVRN